MPVSNTVPLYEKSVLAGVVGWLSVCAWCSATMAYSRGQVTDGKIIAPMPMPVSSAASAVPASGSSCCR